MNNEQPSIAQEENLSQRIVAMASNINYRGQIFGGWTLSQMDLAAGYCGARYSEGPVVTVGANNVKFIQPIDVGDLVSVYSKIIKIGNTSITILIEVWKEDRFSGEKIQTNVGTFTVVAVDEAGNPKPVKKIH